MLDPLGGAEALDNLILQSQNKKLLNELEKHLDNNNYSEDVLPEKVLIFFWKKKIINPHQVKSLLEQLIKDSRLGFSRQPIEELSKATAALIKSGVTNPSEFKWAMKN